MGVTEILLDFGLELQGEPVLDNTIHRVRHRGSKDKRGWYSGVILNGKVYCTYGTWDEGVPHKYTDNGVDSETANEQWAFLAELKRREVKAEQARAAKKAQKIYAEAVPCPSDYPYIVKKGVVPVAGLKFEKEIGAILVPMYSTDGEITSLQRIFADGEKRFLSGGRKKGCCFPIQGNTRKVCVCEGLATGINIHMATGYKVLVAFDAGNLGEVVRAAVEMFFDSEITICADNDHTKTDNTGLIKGRECAEKYHLALRYPKDIQGTDFNDLAAEKGLDAVRATIDNIVQAELYQEPEENNTIPALLLNPPGILKTIADYYNETARRPQPLFAVVTAVAIASVVLSRHYRTSKDNYTSLYFLLIAKSATGKEHVVTVIERVLEAAGLGHLIGPRGYTSEAGVISALHEKPRHICVTDEFGRKLAEAKQSSNSNAASAITQLMESFGRLGGVTRARSYSVVGNAQKRKELMDEKILRPAITMVGLTTPRAFTDNIDMRFINDGTLNRFVIGISSQEPAAVDHEPDVLPVPELISDWCQGYGAINDVLVELPGIERFVLAADGPEPGDPTMLEFTEDALDVIADYDRACVARIKELEFYALEDMPGRLKEIAMRVALICALARCDNQVTTDDVAWAIAFVDWNYEKAIGLVREHVTDSEYERGKTLAYQVIKKFTVNPKGKHPGITKRDLNRAKPFKSMKPKDREEMLKDLCDSGWVQEREMSPVGKKGGRPLTRFVAVAVKSNE